MMYKLSGLFLLLAIFGDTPGMVTLKNGKQVQEAYVNVIMAAVLKYGKEAPPVIGDLIRKAMNPNYQISSYASKFLIEHHLLNSDGSLHEITRNILVSAATDNGFNVTLTDPIKKENESINLTLVPSSCDIGKRAIQNPFIIADHPIPSNYGALVLPEEEQDPFFVFRDSEDVRKLMDTSRRKTLERAHL